MEYFEKHNADKKRKLIYEIKTKGKTILSHKEKVDEQKSLIQFC